MKGEKYMYCSKCGSEINEGANFCYMCGEKVEFLVNKNNSIQQKVNSSEIDREALCIYLKDVLALECIKRKLWNRRNVLKKEIESSKSGGYYKKYNLSIAGKAVHFYYNGKDIYLATDVDPSSPFVIKCDSNFDNKWKWSCIDDNIVKKFSDEYPYADAWSRVSKPGLFNFAGQLINKEFITLYKDFKKIGPLGYQETLKKAESMNRKYNVVVNEYYKVCELLKKAYGVNVIPEIFRNNIYSVYYLYNFISTSNESLTTALLHFDLDEIKIKLDRIIIQQEERIIQQAILTAQNEEMIKQNQIQLNKLSNIEANTDIAAQYTEIAANNAEICAWMSIAQYINR